METPNSREGQEDFNQWVEEGKTLLKDRQATSAFFVLEKARHISQNPELEELLLEASYKGIWGAYSGEQFELMEYLSRFAIQLFTASDINMEPVEMRIKLAKAYNGLAIAMYQLGKRSIEYNIKSSETYEALITTLDDKKTLREVVKSRIKNDFGLIINLGHNGHFDGAKDLAQKTIVLAQEHGLWLEEGLAKKIMGNLLFYAEEYDESFQTLLESAQLFENKKSKEAQKRLSDLYLLICENYFKLEQYDTGKTYLDQSKTLFDKLSNHPYLYYALLGQYSEEINDADQAKKAFLQAISLLNVTKWGVQFESNVDSFLKHKDKEIIYLKAISALLKEGEPLEGFEVFETFRSKLFLENILSGKRESFGEIPLNLRKERESIAKSLRKLCSSPSNYDHEDQIHALKKDLYYCDEKIASVRTSYRGFTDHQLVSLWDSQEKIPQNGLIIEYFYYDNEITIFLIGKQLFETITVKYPSEDLEKLITTYLSLIQKEYANPNWSVIEDFYKQKAMDILVSPIEPYLKNINEIILIPYKILHSFPIHHLFLDLREDILISYLPNFQSIHLLKSSPLIPTNPLIIGDSRDNLKGAREEATQIAGLFGNPSLLIGKDVQKDLVLKEFMNHPMVHYSGHIRYNSKQPLYSYLECSDSEDKPFNSTYRMADEDHTLLHLKEIYRLNLEKVCFLSLSGCSSGLATPYRGEEQVGMVRGFFYAGVQSILATSWDIEDQSSKDFLIAFFKNTFETGGNKKKAFLKAYHLMKEKYQHPFFYGGFTLYESF
ncbi:MAG: hypothetical protein IEMM0008_0034 [bacterium]|nr:MAG: hypothetical protein IEMM0008_0034 [bacterium]